MPETIPTKDVIRILEDISVLLELKGESPFKSIAYANAARRLETLEEGLEELARRCELTSIKDIGEALSKKITESPPEALPGMGLEHPVKTGTCFRCKAIRQNTYIGCKCRIY